MQRNYPHVQRTLKVLSHQPPGLTRYWLRILEYLTKMNFPSSAVIWRRKILFCGAKIWHSLTPCKGVLHLCSQCRRKRGGGLSALQVANWHHHPHPPPSHTRNFFGVGNIGWEGPANNPIKYISTLLRAIVFFILTQFLLNKTFLNLSFVLHSRYFWTLWQCLHWPKIPRKVISL